MRALLRLAPRRRLALAVVLGSLTVLFGAALLATSGALITGASLRPESLLVLLPMITSVRLFAVGRAALRYAERLVSHDLTFRLLGRLRVLLLERLLPLAPAALVGVRGGELLARVRADVDALQGVVLRLVGPTAVAVVAGGASVGLVAVVSVPLAALTAGLLLLLGVAVPLWARRAGAAGARRAAEADAAFGTEVLDLVRGLPDHLAADGGRTALATITAQLDAQQAAEVATARVGGVTTVLRDAIPAVAVVLALWVVGQGVVDGGTDPVLLAAAALGVLGSFEAVAGLGGAWSGAAGMRAAADRLDALREQQPAVVEPERPRALPPGRDLRLEQVAVRHPGQLRTALAGLDLDVPYGDKVALVGPSGTGKTSLLGLVLRALDPSAGRVTLGGVDLRELALDDVRACSAWAAQSPQLLGGSIAGNLRLAAPGAPDERLVAVLERVGLGPLVEAGRLHAWIGEAGGRLSGGERARVGVARALLSPAPILLLDEPTAHLDRRAADALLDLLARQERTVVLVTHSPEHLDDRWRTVAVGAGGTAS